jgi:hypothetical protein
MGAAGVKSAGRSLAARVAITLVVPALLVVIGDRTPIPGFSPEVAAQVGVPAISIFLLGVTPILSGYWTVEVVAFFVPRLSRLRHDNPEGRAKLDRAARVVALAFAAIQAFACALTLEGTGGGDAGWLSRANVVVSLVGGVCIQFVVAQLVSRQRLLNGFLALLGAGALAKTIPEVTNLLGLAPSIAAPYALSPTPSAHVDVTEVAITGLAVTSIVLATWILLRGAGERPWNRPVPARSERPYRDARQLALHPDIPLPASSFQVYPLAFTILGWPSLFASLHVPFPDVSRFLADERSFVAALLGVTLLATWIFARVLHRPAELSNLVGRLGSKAGPKFEHEVRIAVRAALVPSLVFFATLVLAGRASGVGAMSVALLVPIVLDLVHSVRLAKRNASLIPIWEERRGAAIPILRALLASEGIRTEVQGAAVTSFWQVFVPFAPSVLLAPPEQAERAHALLRHLLTGAETPERLPSSPEVARLPAQPWSPKRRAALLLIALAGATLAFTSLWIHRQTPPRTVADGPRAKLELVRVDDSVDPLAAVAEEAIPENSGIGVFDENVPLGTAGTKPARFARIALRAGESKEEARGRFAVWLAGFSLPPGARFGFEDDVDEDAVTKKATVVALRAFVLAGEPELDSEDVTKATAVEPRDGESPFVALTLSSEGAKRFEDLTREWKGRRIAIVVDDEIVCAPVVRSVIAGGRVSVTMGEGDPEILLARANRLARRLAP